MQQHGKLAPAPHTGDMEFDFMFSDDARPRPDLLQSFEQLRSRRSATYSLYGEPRLGPSYGPPGIAVQGTVGSGVRKWRVGGSSDDMPPTYATANTSSRDQVQSPASNLPTNGRGAGNKGAGPWEAHGPVPYTTQGAETSRVGATGQLRKPQEQHGTRTARRVLNERGTTSVRLQGQAAPGPSPAAYEAARRAAASRVAGAAAVGNTVGRTDGPTSHPAPTQAPAQPQAAQPVRQQQAPRRQDQQPGQRQRQRWEMPARNQAGAQAGGPPSASFAQPTTASLRRAAAREKEAAASRQQAALHPPASSPQRAPAPALPAQHAGQPVAGRPGAVRQGSPADQHPLGRSGSAPTAAPAARVAAGGGGPLAARGGDSPGRVGGLPHAAPGIGTPASSALPLPSAASVRHQKLQALKARRGRVPSGASEPEVTESTSDLVSMVGYAEQAAAMDPVWTRSPSPHKGPHGGPYQRHGSPLPTGPSGRAPVRSPEKGTQTDDADLDQWSRGSPAPSAAAAKGAASSDAAGGARREGRGRSGQDDTRDPADQHQPRPQHSPDARGPAGPSPPRRQWSQSHAPPADEGGNAGQLQPRDEASGRSHGTDSQGGGGDDGDSGATSKRVRMAELIRRFREEPVQLEDDGEEGEDAEGSEMGEDGGDEGAGDAKEEDRDRRREAAAQPRRRLPPGGDTVGGSRTAAVGSVADADGEYSGDLDDEAHPVDSLAAAVLQRSRALLLERDVIQHRIQSALSKFRGAGGAGTGAQRAPSPLAVVAAAAPERGERSPGHQAQDEGVEDGDGDGRRVRTRSGASPSSRGAAVGSWLYGGKWRDVGGGPGSGPNGGGAGALREAGDSGTTTSSSSGDTSSSSGAGGVGGGGGGGGLDGLGRGDAVPAADAGGGGNRRSSVAASATGDRQAPWRERLRALLAQAGVEQPSSSPSGAPPHRPASSPPLAQPEGASADPLHAWRQLRQQQQHPKQSASHSPTQPRPPAEVSTLSVAAVNISAASSTSAPPGASGAATSGPMLGGTTGLGVLGETAVPVDQGDLVRRFDGTLANPQSLLGRSARAALADWFGQVSDAAAAAGRHQPVSQPFPAEAEAQMWAPAAAAALAAGAGSSGPGAAAGSAVPPTASAASSSWANTAAAAAAEPDGIPSVDELLTRLAQRFGLAPGANTAPGAAALRASASGPVAPLAAATSNAAPGVASERVSSFLPPERTGTGSYAASTSSVSTSVLDQGQSAGAAGPSELERMGGGPSRGSILTSLLGPQQHPASSRAGTALPTAEHSRDLPASSQDAPAAAPLAAGPGYMAHTLGVQDASSVHEAGQVAVTAPSDVEHASGSGAGRRLEDAFEEAASEESDSGSAPSPLSARSGRPQSAVNLDGSQDVLPRTSSALSSSSSSSSSASDGSQPSGSDSLSPHRASSVYTAAGTAAGAELASPTAFGSAASPANTDATGSPPASEPSGTGTAHAEEVAEEEVPEEEPSAGREAEGSEGALPAGGGAAWPGWLAALGIPRPVEVELLPDAFRSGGAGSGNNSTGSDGQSGTIGEDGRSRDGSEGVSGEQEAAAPQEAGGRVPDGVAAMRHTPPQTPTSKPGQESMPDSIGDGPSNDPGGEEGDGAQFSTPVSQSRAGYQRFLQPHPQDQGQPGGRWSGADGAGVSGADAAGGTSAESFSPVLRPLLDLAVGASLFADTPPPSHGKPQAAVSGGREKSLDGRDADGDGEGAQTTGDWDETEGREQGAIPGESQQVLPWPTASLEPVADFTPSRRRWGGRRGPGSDGGGPGGLVLRLSGDLATSTPRSSVASSGGQRFAAILHNTVTAALFGDSPLTSVDLDRNGGNRSARSSAAHGPADGSGRPSPSPASPTSPTLRYHSNTTAARAPTGASIDRPSPLGRASPLNNNWRSGAGLRGAEADDPGLQRNDRERHSVGDASASSSRHSHVSGVAGDHSPQSGRGGGGAGIAVGDADEGEPNGGEGGGVESERVSAGSSSGGLEQGEEVYEEDFAEPTPESSSSEAAPETALRAVAILQPRPAAASGVSDLRSGPVPVPSGDDGQQPRGWQQRRRMDDVPEPATAGAADGPAAYTAHPAGLARYLAGLASLDISGDVLMGLSGFSGAADELEEGGEGSGGSGSGGGNTSRSDGQAKEDEASAVHSVPQPNSRSGAQAAAVAAAATRGVHSSGSGHDDAAVGTGLDSPPSSSGEEVHLGSSRIPPTASGPGRQTPADSTQEASGSYNGSETETSDGATAGFQPLLYSIDLEDLLFLSASSQAAAAAAAAAGGDPAAAAAAAAASAAAAIFPDPATAAAAFSASMSMSSSMEAGLPPGGLVFVVDDPLDAPMFFGMSGDGGAGGPKGRRAPPVIITEINSSEEEDRASRSGRAGVPPVVITEIHSSSGEGSAAAGEGVRAPHRQPQQDGRRNGAVAEGLLRRADEEERAPEALREAEGSSQAGSEALPGGRPSDAQQWRMPSLADLLGPRRAGGRQPQAPGMAVPDNADRGQEAGAGRAGRAAGTVTYDNEAGAPQPARRQQRFESGSGYFASAEASRAGAVDSSSVGASEDGGGGASRDDSGWWAQGPRRPGGYSGTSGEVSAAVSTPGGADAAPSTEPSSSAFPVEPVSNPLAAPTVIAAGTTPPIPASSLPQPLAPPAQLDPGSAQAAGSAIDSPRQLPAGEADAADTAETNSLMAAATLRPSSLQRPRWQEDPAPWAAPSAAAVPPVSTSFSPRAGSASGGSGFTESRTRVTGATGSSHDAAGPDGSVASSGGGSGGGGAAPGLSGDLRGKLPPISPSRSVAGGLDGREALSTSQLPLRSGLPPGAVQSAPPPQGHSVTLPLQPQQQPQQQQQQPTADPHLGDVVGLLASMQTSLSGLPPPPATEVTSAPPGPIASVGAAQLAGPLLSQIASGGHLSAQHPEHAQAGLAVQGTGSGARAPIRRSLFRDGPGDDGGRSLVQSEGSGGSGGDAPGPIRTEPDPPSRANESQRAPAALAWTGPAVVAPQQPFVTLTQPSSNSQPTAGALGTSHSYPTASHPNMTAAGAADPSATAPPVESFRPASGSHLETSGVGVPAQHPPFFPGPERGAGWPWAQPSGPAGIPYGALGGPAAASVPALPALYAPAIQSLPQQVTQHASSSWQLPGTELYARAVAAVAPAAPAPAAGTAAGVYSAPDHASWSTAVAAGASGSGDRTGPRSPPTVFGGAGGAAGVAAAAAGAADEDVIVAMLKRKMDACMDRLRSLERNLRSPTGL